MRHVRTQFGATTIHEELNLTVWPGEIVALIGGSGSGKTTLLRQILGLAQPSAGSICVFGMDITQADRRRLLALRQRWGMLFQHGALFSAMNAYDNVAQPMRELRALPEDLIHDAVLLKLHMVGITPADALKMPADLSGGMQKRVALARALALEPELLCLDEPTAGLDPSLAHNFVELIRALHAAMRLTVLMVTHDVVTLLALATQIAVLADKRLIAKGPPGEVMALPHPFIRDFFQGVNGNGRAADGK
jgi:phospholipid/cholesterol/gamma-HCH transport system ATP-binding protein